MKSSIRNILYLAVLTSAFCIALSQRHNHERIVVLSSEDHEPITDIEQIKKFAASKTELKALRFKGEDGHTMAKELLGLMKELEVEREKVSSMIGNQEQIQELSDFDFEQVGSVEDLKKILQQNGDVIIHLVEEAKDELLEQPAAPRTLQEEEQEQTNGDNSEGTSVSDNAIAYQSKLFINMTPATLSGLLVTLFLLVVLIIAINCLYNVKTNDSFGRNNLWVGKES